MRRQSQGHPIRPNHRPRLPPLGTTRHPPLLATPNTTNPGNKVNENIIAKQSIIDLKNILVEIVCTLQHAIDNDNDLHAATAIGCLINLSDSTPPNTTKSEDIKWTPWDVFMYGAFGTRDEPSPMIEAAEDHFRVDPHDDRINECSYCVNLDNAFEEFLTSTRASAMRRATKGTES